jgi:hypothetical protein
MMAKSLISPKLAKRKFFSALKRVKMGPTNTMKRLQFLRVLM